MARGRVRAGPPHSLSKFDFESLRRLNPVAPERVRVHAWELSVVDVVRDPVVEPPPPEVIAGRHTPTTKFGRDCLAVVHQLDVRMLGDEWLGQIVLDEAGVGFASR